MKITPVKGTNDYLPAQAELRNYLQKKICETYEQAGFQRIATPIIEDIENLDKSEGGDNLNLIFKVMKRGEKLKKAIASQNPDNIADMINIITRKSLNCSKNNVIQLFFFPSANLFHPYFF